MFYTMCGFSERNFPTLYEVLERLLTKPKRRRKIATGPIDGFLLFLHWLRTTAPIDSIAGAFHLRPVTLYKTLKKIAMEIHGQLTERFIATSSHDRWTTGEKFSDCGLIVDATVQQRGRPAGESAEAKLFFSGKHHIYCLKSQVVTNREGIAIHVVAGVTGSVHDMRLFKDHQHHLSALIMLHEGERTKILVDKGYIGEVDDPAITLVTPKKNYGGLPLDRMQARYNRRWLNAYCRFGAGRHGRGPIGAVLFQVANRREAMALLSPTMSLYPGSAPTHLVRAHMELEQQSK
jgi:hypothetical protein